MTLISISPAEAHGLIAKGAQLIDIRGRDEHARENIACARNVPLEQLASETFNHGVTVIFHCKSGMRTQSNAPLLAKLTAGNAFIVQGGIDAWKAAGLPCAKNTRQPVEMMRQIQIAAGSLALLGAVLGFAVNPTFYALSGAVGAGLVFSGISGTCAMRHVLAKMPWNRQALA
jgi:rhodanese-related sulfurtransferase